MDGTILVGLTPCEDRSLYYPMGTLHVVGTPIGNLSDLSERAADVLRRSDVVYAEDTRRSRVLLDHVGSTSKLVSLHRHNEVERTPGLLQRLEAGEAVALVSDAGTPLVSDPGESAVRSALDAGHSVVSVPGPSAVLAALVASGFDGVPFTFLGFPARKGSERAESLERIALSTETVVLFESPERVVRLLKDLSETCGIDRRVAVARELTKVHESVFRGTLEEAVRFYTNEAPRGEVTVVVEGAPNEPEAGSIDREAAECLARAIVASGLTGRRAAAELARRLRIPKNLAYEVVHSL